MPYYSKLYYRGKRTTTYPYRTIRRPYSLYRGGSRPARLNGFWPGTRSSFRRVLGFKRTSMGLIKSTYTIPEKKYIDNATRGQAVTNSGVLFLLNGLTQGTSATTRVGQRIMMKNFHLKCLILAAQVGQTPTITMSLFRVMVLYDVQPNGATPSVTDILETNTGSLGPLSPMSIANGSRFKVLYDQRFLCNNQLSAGVLPPKFSNWMEKFQKMNLETQYAAANTGTVTDIRTGSLFLLFISDETAAANACQVDFYCRVRYYDN